MGRLIQFNKMTNNGDQYLEKYHYPASSSFRVLIRREDIKNKGNYQSIETFEYDKNWRLVVSIQKSSSPLDDNKINTVSYVYNDSGLLTEKETTIEEAGKDGGATVTTLKHYYEYY